MEWKDSKLIIAISSAATAIVFMITIYTYLIIPTHCKIQDNNLKELQNDIQNIQTLKSENKKYKIAYLNLKAQWDSIFDKNPFQHQKVIPLGFHTLQFNEKLPNLEQLYPNYEIEWSKKYVTIKLENKFFSQVALYFHTINDKKFLTAMLFLYKDSLASDENISYLIALLKNNFPSISFKESEDEYEFNQKEYTTKVKNYNLKISNSGLHID